MRLGPKIITELPGSMGLASPSSCPLLPRAYVPLVLPAELRGNTLPGHSFVPVPDSRSPPAPATSYLGWNWKSPAKRIWKWRWCSQDQPGLRQSLGKNSSKCGLHFHCFQLWAILFYQMMGSILQIVHCTFENRSNFVLVLTYVGALNKIYGFLPARIFSVFI